VKVNLSNFTEIFRKIVCLTFTTFLKHGKLYKLNILFTIIPLIINIIIYNTEKKKKLRIVNFIRWHDLDMTLYTSGQHNVIILRYIGNNII